MYISATMRVMVPLTAARPSQLKELKKSPHQNQYTVPAHTELEDCRYHKQ